MSILKVLLFVLKNPKLAWLDKNKELRYGFTFNICDNFIKNLACMCYFILIYLSQYLFILKA